MMIQHPASRFIPKLRLKIRNFLSFFEETVFDMFPNPKRTSFPNHIYEKMSVPLLKQAAIYGANGSGKSNFIKAISFISSFVTDEDFLKKIDLDEYIFQLAENLLPLIEPELTAMIEESKRIEAEFRSKKKLGLSS